MTSLVSEAYEDMSDDGDIEMSLIPLSQYLGLKDCKENRENPRDFDLKIFPSEQFGWDMRRLKFLIDNEKVGAYSLTETIIYYHLTFIYVLLLNLLDA